MRKKNRSSYFLIFFSLLAVMSIPKTTTEKLQGVTVAMLAPAWQPLLAFKSFFVSEKNNEGMAAEDNSCGIEKLRLENISLKEEIIHLKDVMQQELKLIDQMNEALKEDGSPLSTKTLKARHRMELKKLLQMNLEAVPAKVIFRSPESWNSSFWINVGSATNTALGRTTVAKNSPVLLGSSVIGVIDYVGKYQARVKLITDSGLSPSIRAVRGGIQSKLIAQKIIGLIYALKNNPKVFDNHEMQQMLVEQLEMAIPNIPQIVESHYLAKGELYGSSKPLWRSQRHLLSGTGFNYDFADGEGPARDLRTGHPIPHDPNEISLPIVKVGDVLVTTGMDGVFPAGLMVAEVTQVHPLKEGDYFYELDATPIAGNFDNLSTIFVIPPVNDALDEHPTTFEWK